MNKKRRMARKFYQRLTHTRKTVIKGTYVVFHETYFKKSNCNCVSREDNFLWEVKRWKKTHRATLSNITALVARDNLSLSLYQVLHMLLFIFSCIALEQVVR